MLFTAAVASLDVRLARSALRIASLVDPCSARLSALVGGAAHDLGLSDDLVRVWVPDPSAPAAGAARTSFFWLPDATARCWDGNDCAAAAALVEQVGVVVCVEAGWFT